MADDEPKKLESEPPSEPSPPQAAELVEEPTKNVAEEKSIIQLTPPEKTPADDSKPLLIIESNLQT